MKDAESAQNFADVFSMIRQFLLKHWIQVRLGSIFTGNVI
jgi:hypothetical protein